MKQLNELPQVNQLIETLADNLKIYLSSRQLLNPAMIGIHTGGLWVAKALHQALNITQPLGELDISFYRDDFKTIGLHPEVKPSNLPFDVHQQNIILVDDVIYTGRTIRAALNELFDYGRPNTITLVSLIERDGRELPIRPDIVGQQVTLSNQQTIKLEGPNPLKLVIKENHHASNHATHTV